MKSVIVFGLLRGQARIVNTRFGKDLDLSFIPISERKGGDSLRKVRTNSASKDSTLIVMSDFVSHAHERHLKKASSRYIRISGGITRLCDKLQHLVEENLNGS